MNCPACSRMLQEMTVGGIIVDVCNGGCGGIWFDQFELKKMDEPHEAEGQSLLDIERDESIVVDHTQRRKCPKCDDMVMMRHFFCTERQIEVDECPACAGFWLDCGELATIRSQCETDADRDAAAEAYFSKTVGPELEKMASENQEKHQKARRIANIFKYICPTYYIPGKQNWGAF